MFILHCTKLPKTELRGFPGHAGPTENPLGKTLFQHLHHDGWISLVRFADQEMEVLGHDYISQNHETIALTHLLEDRQEEIAATCTGQVLPPVITTAGDEVQVPGTGIAFEIPGHDESVTLEWSDFSYNLILKRKRVHKWELCMLQTDWVSKGQRNAELVRD